MKRLLTATGLFLGVCGPLTAAPSAGPAGNFILNTSTDVTKQIFKVSSGTVTSQFSLPYITAGQCTTVDAAGRVSGTPCGSGSANVAVTTGNAGGFNTVTSSPTSVINFDSTTYKVNLKGSATAFIQVNPDSVTLQGNNLSATYLTNSSATATYLQLSSASANFLTQSSATVTYFNSSNILPLVNGGTGLSSPGLVAGTNITSITGAWPNQTINAATQAGSGGSSSLQVTKSGVQITSPTSSLNFYGGDFGVTAVGTTSQVILNPATTDFYSPLNQPPTTVLISSGIAFGSPTNTVTQDTMTFVYLHDGSNSVAVGTSTPYIVNASGLNFTLYGSSTTIDVEDTGNRQNGLFIRNNTSGTYGETGMQLLGSAGNSFIGGSAAGDTVISNKTGKIIFQNNWPTGGASGYFSTSGLNLGGLTASQFIKTDASKNLVSYDLLNTTQTWSGQNNWTTPAQSTFTYGLTVASLTVNGAGDGIIIETINGSTYTVASSSGVITPGHCAKWSNTTNYTLLDAGLCSNAPVPGGPTNAVQYNNAGTFAGSNSFQFNGTSVTVVSSMTINTGGGSDNPVPGLFNVYAATSSFLGRYLLTIGSQNKFNQLLLLDNQGMLLDRGLVTNVNGSSVVVGASDDDIHSGSALDNKINLYSGSGVLGEMDLQTTANRGQPIVLLPGQTKTVSVSSNVVIVVSSMIVQGANGLNVTYNVNPGSMTGAGLTTCGDATHAVGYTSTTGLFSCQTVTGSGGGGSSSLQVTKSGVQITSPTASLNFYGGDFGVTAIGTTAQIILNPSTTDFIWNTSALQSGATFYVSSGTINGPLRIYNSFGAMNLFGGNSITPAQIYPDAASGQLGLGGLISQPAVVTVLTSPVGLGANIGSGGVYAGAGGIQTTYGILLSTINANAFNATTTSATVTGPAGFNSIYSVTAGSMTASSATINGQLTASTLILNNPLAVAQGGTGTTTPGLVAGTNITSITGSWPNQTINAATQSGGGGSSLAVSTGTSSTYNGVPVSSPTPYLLFDSRTTAGQLLSASTYFMTLLPSSVTLQGQLPTSLGTVTTGVWNGTRLTSGFIPTDVAYTDVANNFISSQTNTSAGGELITYGINAASMTLTGLAGTSNTGTLLQLNVNNPVAASNSIGGAININMTNSTGTAMTIYSNQGANQVGNMLNIRMDNPSFNQNGLFMDCRGSAACVTIKSSSTPGGYAFNIIGASTHTSTMQLAGTEADVGTFKITHTSPTIVAGQSDANASVLSLSLAGAGTQAQGLFIDAPSGTTGKLLNLRNTSIEQLTLAGDGTLTNKYGIIAASQTIINATSPTTLFVSTASTGVAQLSVSSTIAVNPIDPLLSISSASGTTILWIDNAGNLISSGTTTTVTSCGTSPSVIGNNIAGTITVGGGVVTSCTLNFANGGFVNVPVCIPSDNSTTVSVSNGATTATSAVFNTSATLGGGLINYICIGMQK